jgi:hypothetical protein
MFRKMLIGSAIAGVLAFGIPTQIEAQTSPAKQHLKKAGRKMKKAGKATGEAAKATGQATKEAAKAAEEKTEDAAKKTGAATKRGAKNAKRKITPGSVSATCNDGTVQSGKTKATACANHGGVKG